MLFYDGHCALCHGAVTFVLKHDRGGTLFRFAPLQGETFKTRISADNRPVTDSVVVLTADERLLLRSSAFIHILRRLGGRWKFLAAVIDSLPRSVRDAVYDFVARIRYRVFGRRDSVCPVMPAELRARFDP